jgi:hypothetical protein
MTRSVLLLAAAAALAACGTRNTPTRGDRAAAAPAPADDTRDDAGPAPVKRVLLAWGLEPLPSGTKTKVFLTTTDEMGRAVSHPLGDFDGACTDVGAIELYRAALAVTCGQDGRGVQLHAVAGRGEVLILAMDIAEGTDPDPMARRQLARIETPIDAAISAAP